MDELQLVRDLHAEPDPPTASTARQARHKLEELMTQAPTPANPLTTGRGGDRTRPWWRRSRRWSFGLAGVAAAATALAVGIPLAIPGDVAGEAPGDRETATAPLDARNVLLAAANGAAQAEPSTGRYWHVRSIDVVPFTVGPADDRYTVVRRIVTEEWAARDAGGKRAVGRRDIGARPATKADEAAWRRDGSPTRWDLGAGDTSPPSRLVLTTEPQPGDLVWDKSPGRFALGEAAHLTAEQLANAPSEPGALRTYLLGMPKGDVVATPEALLFQRASMLLAAVPTTPQVRAAAFRVLAALPGVHSDGRNADPIGRPGVGITLDQKEPTAADHTIIVDPSSGALLSAGYEVKAKKSKQHTVVYLGGAWSDEQPHIPSTQVS